MGLHNDLWLMGFLVRIGQSCKLPDLAGQGFPIQPFQIPGREDLNRALDVHFNELGAVTFDCLPNLFPNGAIG